MKKLLTVLAIVGMAFSAQAQASLADRINENQTDRHHSLIESTKTKPIGCWELGRLT